MANNGNNVGRLGYYRIVQNVVCRCGNLYQYRDWEDNEKKCPRCGHVANQ